MASKYSSVKEKQNIWYQNNKDKARINNLKYRQSHREICAEREKIYKNSLNGRIRGLLVSSKKYAQQRNQEFSITYDDVLDLWNKQQHLCAISKVEMQLDSGTRKNKNYFRISIDRIDNSIGYVKNNIQLVCFAVNQIKSDFTLDEFKFWIKTISSQAFDKKEGSTTIPKGSRPKLVETPGPSNEGEDIVSSIQQCIAA